MRERAVVREQERAGRVGVEAPDRNDARLSRNELDDGGTSLRIARGRHDAGRLVEQEVREALERDGRAVDRDLVARLDERVELPGLSVDEDASGLDQVVGAASRRDAGAGEIGVETHG